MDDDAVDLAEAILSRISGSLSLLGSLTIAASLLRRHDRSTRLKKVNNSILLGMALADLPSSLMWILGTVMVPGGGTGTTQTCSIYGFFFQVGLAIPCYNASLCLYYLSVVRYGQGGGARGSPSSSGEDSTTDKAFQCCTRRAGAAVHFFILLYVLGAGSISLALKLYNPMGSNFCFIAGPLPKGCDSPGSEVQCTRGRDAHMWGALLVSVPIATVFWIVVVSMSMLCRTVYRKTKDADRFAPQGMPGNSRLQQLLRDTQSQAILYVSAFFCTYIWWGIGSIISGFAGEDFPGSLQILSAIFLPLQGLWNAIIFLRPRIASIKSGDPNVGIIQGFRMAAFGPPGSVAAPSSSTPHATNRSAPMT